MKAKTICATSALAIMMALAVVAQVPESITSQGRLMDLNGAPLENNPATASDGQIDLVFRLYDASSGGNEVWSQTTNNVPVFNGLFSVLLTNLNTTVFSAGSQANRWLEMEVRTSAATNILGPRKELVSVAYAIRAGDADTLDGNQASSFLLLSGGTMTGDLTLSGAARIQGTAIIDSQAITDGTIASADIADKAIITDKLADNAVTTAKIADDAVTSAKIEDGAIVDADIATDADIAATKIADEAVVKTTEFSGMITGRWNKLTISNEVVTSAMIKDGAITNDDVSPTANIAASKILVGAIAPHQPLSAQTHVSNLWGTIGFVVGKTGREPFSSVQAAINAAVSQGYGQMKPVTIEVKPGEYSENLTFSAGIHLKAEIEDALFSARLRGTHQYNYTDPNNLGDLFISGIYFDSPAGGGAAPIFSISGNGFTSIRMNHCVLNSSDNQPVLRLSNTGFQGTRLSNTELFHCRIRNLRTDFTGTALVELNAGSLLLDDGEATLVDSAEKSFRASGMSQLLIDNAQIKGRIETANNAYLQLTQSSIDSGNQPCIAHNSTITAIALEVFLITTKSGDVVTGTGPFFYNNIVYYYAAVAGIDQTLAATLTGGSSALALTSAKQTAYMPTTFARSDWTNAVGSVPPNVSEALSTIIRGDYIWKKEFDPWFRASPAYGISAGSIAAWNAAYGWGNHSAAGYFKADGSVPATGDFNMGGRQIVNVSTIQVTAAAGAGKVLTSDGNGYGAWAEPTDRRIGTNALNYVPKWNGTALVAGAIYDPGTGNVGIGTNNPAEKLHVAGNARVDGTNIAAAITLGGETRTNWPTLAVGALLAANNLADLPDKALARVHLGLGSAALNDTTAFLAPTGNGSQLTGITASQVGALTPDGNGSQLTGITAAQVGALSVNGGVVDGALDVKGAFTLVPSGDIPMGVYTNR